MYTNNYKTKIKAYLENRKIILFGAGKKGERCLSQLKRMGMGIYGFVDNNPNKQKQQFAGIEVLNYNQFNKIVSAEPEKYIIVITLQNCEILVSLMTQLQFEFGDTVPIYSYEIVEELFADFIANSSLSNYQIDFDTQAELWVDGLFSEVEFWFKEVASVNGLYHQNYSKRINQKEFKVSGLKQNIQNNAIVLDVGCGLYPKYGNQIENGKVKLIPVDPLAFFYDSINRSFLDETASQSVKIEFGMFEFLSSFFNENCADIILIDNALDHCIDPLKAILECLKVLKPNGEGILSMRHYIREGINEKYAGLHHWNMDVNINNEFIIWNEYNVVNVSQLLKGTASLEVICDRDHIEPFCYCDYLTVNIIKDKDFDIKNLVTSNDSERFALIIKYLMKKQSDLNSMKNYLDLMHV